MGARRKEPHRELGGRKPLAFTIVAVLLGLGIIELSARVVLSPSTNPRWQYQQEVISFLGFPELRRILEPDPDQFWILKPDLTSVPIQGSFGGGQEWGFEVSTDGHRFRRSAGAPSPARRRVLFLGDSTTFGLGVNDEETYCSLLAGMVRDIAVANAGVPGYTAYQGRKWLERIRKRVWKDAPPDAVCFCFGRNDDRPWDMMSDAEHDAAFRRIRRLESLGIARLMRQLLGRRRAVEPDWDHEGRPRLSDEEYRTSLRELVTECRDWGSEPLFLVWPEASQMREGGRLPKQAAMLEVASELGVGVVDVARAFRRHGGGQLFLDAVHANRVGNAVAAGAVASGLERIGVISTADIRRPAEPATGP